ncbi:MAG: hypothetical protein ACUVRF_06850 [Desulfotomaculales bacterium]
MRFLNFFYGSLQGTRAAHLLPEKLVEAVGCRPLPAGDGVAVYVRGGCLFVAEALLHHVELLAAGEEVGEGVPASDPAILCRITGENLAWEDMGPFKKRRRG